jgi:hypothetical protein
MSSTPTIADPLPPKPQSVPEMTSVATSGGSLAVAVAEAPEPVASGNTELNIDAIREAVLLEFQDQKTLFGPLEDGEWGVEGIEVVVKTTLSATLIDFAFTADLKRRAVGAVARVAGRPMKFRIASGGSAAPSNKPARASAGGTSARAKASQHPVVQKMIEKFGAEIRTIMDPDRK